MHGYDLRKRLREELGPFSNLSFGSLYPALARLERSGAVETLLDDERSGEAPAVQGSGAADASQLTRRAAARAAAALGGRGTRARKVYDITERGELLFEELLEVTDAGDDPRNFLLRLGFARHLSPASRLRLLERRRLQLVDRVERARRLLGQRRSQLDRYGLAILEHSLELAASDLAWVEGLLAAESAAPAAANAGPVNAPGTVAGGRAAGEAGSDALASARQRAVAGSAGSAGELAGTAGGFAGILHAGRLRRRPESARPVPQQTNRRKEQVER